MPHNLLQSLEFIDGEWEAEVSFPVLGENTLLVLEANELDGPSENQKEKLNWLYENIQTLITDIESAVFQYYQDQFEGYHQKLGKQASQLMPTLNAAKDVWNQVFEPGIYIAPDEDNEIHLEYECSFDEENGLRVIIIDGKISKVCL